MSDSETQPDHMVNSEVDEDPSSNSSSSDDVSSDSDVEFAPSQTQEPPKPKTKRRQSAPPQSALPQSQSSEGLSDLCTSFIKTVLSRKSPHSYVSELVQLALSNP
ncbi:hypothetical protein GEMRC1_007400 [Eukaryota sp. GEM-RC1]